MDKTAQVDLARRQQWSRITWALWTIYMIVTLGGLTAVRFGSNLWFARPIHFDGPYQMAVFLIEYALPFITIIIPLMLRQATRLPLKHEVKHHDHDAKN